MKFYYDLLYSSNAILSIVCRRDTLGLAWSSASRGEGRCRFMALYYINRKLYKEYKKIYR